MWKWMGFGAVLWCLCACQNKVNSISAPVAPSDTTLKLRLPRTAVASDQLNDLLNLSVVTCEESSCPEAVGSLLSWYPDKKHPNQFLTYECTGFLVTPDIVATNSHCIPWEVKQHPDLCATYVGIKFPAQGDKTAETYKCAQLIQASPVPKVESDEEMPIRYVDYAFFRVQSASKRHALDLSRRGVKNETALTLYVSDPEPERKMDKNDNHIYTAIRKKQCQSKQGTVVFSVYDNDFADFIFGLGDKCHIEKGNSGSPAIDDSGEVVALLFAKSRELPNEVSQYLQKFGGVGEPKNFTNNALFTNFACLDVAKDVGLGPPASECGNRDQLQKVGEALANENSVKDENAEINRVGEVWFKTAPRMFRFQPLRQIGVNAALQSVVSWNYQLQCLLPQEYWENSAQLSQNRLTVKYTAPVYVYQPQVDDSGRAKRIKVSSHTSQVTLNLDTSLVGATDSVVGTQTVDGKSSPLATHWCSRQEITSH